VTWSWKRIKTFTQGTQRERVLQAQGTAFQKVCYWEEEHCTFQKVRREELERWTGHTVLGFEGCLRGQALPCKSEEQLLGGGQKGVGRSGTPRSRSRVELSHKPGEKLQRANS
jgi:hypothetical protein